MIADRTLDPTARSWVESAQQQGTDFPLQNLPLGVFRGDAEPRLGVAIGTEILDLRACAEAGLLRALPGAALEACTAQSLNPLMGLGRNAATAVRSAVHALLVADVPRKSRDAAASALRRAGEVTMLVPARVGDYSDFYASIDHATNVGSMFRPDNPLLPNYKFVPIGYHGRASSIVVSGTPVVRPNGQTKAQDADAPTFGPSRMLDYEAEVGFFVGGANRLGEAVPLEKADDRIFGFCLVNDWSARDVQSWEYQPLGPFLAKNFATSVSPWVVLTDALTPFRVPAARRAPGDPDPLPYLMSKSNVERGGLALELEAWLSSEAMRNAAQAPVRLSRGDFARMYWTPAQMLTHHASNGCNLEPGDLLASGTVSGPSRAERGCLLELTWRGRDPIALPTGESRTFLEDGDEVILRGRCRKEGAATVGFGECRGVVQPAQSQGS